MWDQKYVVLKELIYLIRFPLLTKEEFNRHQGPVKYDLSCSHEKDESRSLLPPGLHELMGDYYRVEKDLSRLYVMPFTTLPRGPAQLACRRLTDVAGRGNHPLLRGK